MIDREDRSHNGVGVKGKSSIELQETISTTWLQVFGRFKNLIIDKGEGNLHKRNTCILEELAVSSWSELNHNTPE